MSFQAIIEFLNLAPEAIKTWVEGLPLLGKITLLDIFALFGAGHLVGMALIGGCSILLNIRMMGAGITSSTTAEIEQNLRPWLKAGIWIAIGSGLVMGALTASKLYGSSAFLSKMLALAAALTFSYGVIARLARNGGEVTQGVRIAGIIGGVLWALSLTVFAVTEVVNVGLFHLITAGFALLVIFGEKRTKIISAATFLVLYGGIFIMYFIVGFNVGYMPEEKIYLDITFWAVILGLLVVLALLYLEVRAPKAEAASPLARMLALFAILSWVTVAAGGRWIGFSP